MRTGGIADPRYRPDIDGLRAIAVLAVVFFHLGFPGFRGGYVGVDIFFVVSGFLITRLIRDQIAEGGFTFSGFYLRRARRLFAALAFTLTGSFVAAYFLFSPKHFQELGGSVLYVLLSISNFYFWSQSGYFDTEAVFKPLLHTWSLSVEEQFYLVWPLTLFLLIKRAPRWVAPSFIVVAGVLSFLAGSRWLQTDASGAFYLAPFRVVEFAFGAILVWLVTHQPRRNVVKEVLVVAGLAMIGYGFFTFSPEAVFPTLKSLVPVLGSTLLVYAGTARYSGLLLRNPLAVGIGLISYSLYLVHWPILVFYSYSQGELSRVERIAIVVLSCIAATLMYWFVEQPFRRGFRRATAPTYGFACALLALLLSFPAAHAWANGGWPWRFGGGVATDFDVDILRLNTFRYLGEHVVGAYFKTDRRKVLVVGDSHAADVANALSMALDSKVFEVRYETFDDVCYLYIATGKAPPDRPADPAEIGGCTDQLAAYRNSLKVKSADVVVFSNAWAAETAAAAPHAIRLTRRLSGRARGLAAGSAEQASASVKIVVLGRAPEFPNLQASVLKLLSAGATIDQVNRKAFSWQSPHIGSVSRALAEHVRGAGALFAGKDEVVCPESSCTILSEAGELMLWDAEHWTVHGQRLFGKRLVENNPGLFD
jgi:peptidoglycan/LPS O-acetylase OafA/YrhL